MISYSEKTIKGNCVLCNYIDNKFKWKDVWLNNLEKYKISIERNMITYTQEKQLG